MTETSYSTSKVDPLAVFTMVNGAKSPEAAMKDLCRRMRFHCNMHQPPFGLMTLTRLLKVDVQRTSRLPKKVNGLLERRESGYVILVNDYLPWRRARSTIAHELGHVLLFRSLSRHPEALRELRAPQNWETVEALCDVAASELLMPIDDLWAYAFPNLLDVFDSNLHAELYDRYLVSYTNLFRRYLNVGVDAVLFWRATPSQDITWKLSAAYHNEKFYIPPKLSANKRLKPNVFDDIDPDERGWRRDIPSVDFEFQGRRLRGRCVVIDATTHRPQPIFEGFRIPDESNLSFSAVMLMQFNR